MKCDNNPQKLKARAYWKSYIGSRSNKESSINCVSWCIPLLVMWAPSYLNDMVTRVADLPCRACLRSVSSGLLDIPQSRTG